MSHPAELVVVGPRPLQGRVRVPGDKGISHRALLLGAMADGTSRVTGLAPGDDVHRTRAALTHLGVRVRARDGGVTVRGGGIGALREPPVVLDCGNSGTSLRLLLGLLAGRPFHSVLTGDASLLGRPMRRIVEPLRTMGARIDGRGDGARAPLAVRGGPLWGRHVDIAVASAQVKTALLLAGLQAEGTTEVHEPSPSRDHTERMLAALGAPLERLDDRTVRVRAGAPDTFELDVPGDPSSAACFVVAAAITPGSELLVEDVSINPRRIGFVDVLRRMGVDISVRERATRLGEPVGDLAVGAARLHATTIAGDEIPSLIDEIPVLAVAAAFAEGVTEIRDAGELRVKESDRIATLAQELSQLGVSVETRADGLAIRGGQPKPATMKSHGDHRIAMAAAIAANAVEGESRVRGWPAVAVSYPSFAADLDGLVVGR